MGVALVRDLPAQDQMAELEQKAIEAAVARVADSVVQIETIGGVQNESTPKNEGPATGTVVDANGYILASSMSLVHEPTAIFVRLANGQRLTAELVSRDHSRGLTLLKVDSEQSLSVPTAIPRNKLQVGQRTVAVGKVFDAKSPNLSIGVLSATNRIWGRAVQTDAKISPNNFGGPLIDLEGRVIGILTPLSPQGDGPTAGSDWYDSGIGFAVPLSEILENLGPMKEGNDLRAGKMGIAFQGSNPIADKPTIAACRGNSPAARAGLRPGDTIIEVDGVPIEYQNQLRHLVGPRYAGDSVTFTVIRDGKRFESSIELAAEVKPFIQPYLGILPARTAANEGVGVRGVFKDSPAKNAGLKIGDRVDEFDGKPVRSADDLREFLMAATIGKPIQLGLRRGEKRETVSVSLTAMPESSNVTEWKQPKRTKTVLEAEIKVPEETNNCFAIVPESTDSPSGLLVWVPTPGEIDREELVSQWSTWCADNQVILLVPESADSQRWQTSETEVIRKMAEQAMNTYAVDANRVAIGGRAVGGTMATLTAFPNRRLFRGVVMIDIGLPRRLTRLETDPVHRLLVLALGIESSKHEVVDQSVKKLRQSHFAVEHRVEKRDSLLPSLARWMDQLDRL